MRLSVLLEMRAQVLYNARNFVLADSMTQSTPAPEAIHASANIQLSQAQMKLLLHLQMLQRQSGDGTMQVTLLVSRQRIEMLNPQQVQRIVFA